MHISREVDSAADWAAKFGHQRSWASFLLDELSCALTALVSDDVKRAAAIPLSPLSFSWFVPSIEKNKIILYPISKKHPNGFPMRFPYKGKF